jgi:voltage-gated potassium channel
MTGASRSPGSTRHLVLVVMALVVVIALGTVGYIVIEGWPAFDAFYMTVTTVATVGYQEIHPLSPAGRAFTIVLIISGVGTLFYVLGNLARLLLEGELRAIFGRYRSEGKMKALTNHYIVCDTDAWVNGSARNSARNRSRSS